MELSEYLGILRRRWISVVACTLLGLLVGGGISLAIRPTYTATTQLFVAIQNTGSISELQQGNSFTQARIQSYVETAQTPAVLQPAIDALGLPLSPAQLRSKIRASADLNTVIVTVSAEDNSPVQAASIAQAVGDSLISTVGELESSSGSDVSPVKLSVVTPATAPPSPSSPNAKFNMLMGLLLGAVVGVTSAVLRTVLDNRIRNESDLRQVTGAPLLGGVLFDTDATKKPLITQVPGQSPRAESFRQIRTNIQFTHINRESKSFLVTSSLPAEGKSTTAANMAIAMAQAGQRVVLVDGDLRRPMVSTYLGLERDAGLTTALVGKADVMDLLQPWGQDELYVLTSGQVPPNPSEILGSQAMGELIHRLEDTFDAVVVDAPPLLPVTDAAVLAQKVGGVVVVVGSAKVKKHDLERSLSSLDLVDAAVLGVVLNMLPSKGPDAYAYSYYSNEAHSETRRNIASRPASTFKGSHMKSSRRARGREANLKDVIS